MELTIKTKKRQEMIDITDRVNELVKNTGIKSGLCNVYVKHTTAALVINENDDPNIEKDFLKTLNEIIPKNNGYLHDNIDNNAQAHIIASILSPSINIPIRDNKLALGRWQALMLIELDGPRERKILVTCLGNHELNF